MVKAVILVKSSKKLIAAKIGKIDQIFESFPVSGQFDAVVRIEVDDLSTIKDIATKIQKMIILQQVQVMRQTLDDISHIIL